MLAAAGAETESVFGGQFKDDPGGLKLKHDRKVRHSCSCMHAGMMHVSVVLGSDIEQASLGCSCGLCAVTM